MNRCSSVKQPGFTLIELIVVMMIIGILAVAVLPRLLDRSAFEERGFHDETLSILRYAQKTAVAQRRLVCASFTATQVTLRMSTNFGGACDLNVRGPSGSSPYQVTARGAVQFSAVPAALAFNPNGSTSAAASIQVSGASSVITVVRETGYVY